MIYPNISLSFICQFISDVTVPIFGSVVGFSWFFNKNCNLRLVSVFMVPDVNHSHSKLWELENKWISDWYRIGTGYMVANRLLLHRGKPNIMCITASSAAVNGSHFTGWSKGVHAPSPTAHETPSDGPQYRMGLKRQEEEGDCNIIPASPWHQDGAILGLGHQRQMTLHPSTSRQWWRLSQLSIILMFLQINPSLKTDWACKVVCH